MSAAEASQTKPARGAPGPADSRPQSAILADYAVNLSLADVPAEVKQKAMLCIMDTIGAMVAAAENRVGAIVTDHAVKHGKAGPCMLFGRKETVDVESAALANGTLGHVLELDDGHRPSDNHLGCVVVPGAFAAAEHVGASGADLLKAVIVGYDIMGRVGAAVCLPRLQTPFHGTGTTGGFGSASAAGVLFGLDEARFAHALGIAGTGAAGTREVFVSGADCKSYQVGRATWNGINAALLAEAGLEGPRDIFEGQFGFVGAMTSLPRPELVVSELGARFAVMDSAFKVHAVCGLLFTAIDASLALRGEHSIDPAAIERIQVALPGWVREDPVFTRRRPDTVGTSRFSVPYAVAAAFQEGEVTPRQISERALHDPAIAALEKKIEISVDPKVEQIFNATKDDEFFYYPASVTVTAGGKDYHRLEKSPRGYDLRRGLTAEEVIAKFVDNSTAAIGRSAAEEAAGLLLDLEKLGSVTRLSVLRPS